MNAVGRNDHPPGGDFVAHLLGRQVRLALGDAAHFGGDRSQPGVFQLRHRSRTRPAESRPRPIRSSRSQPGRSDQSAGMKSQAVLCDGSGMPGVSGDENVYRPAAPGAILPGRRKACRALFRLARRRDFRPSGGSGNGNGASADPETPAGPEVDMSEILL